MTAITILVAVLLLLNILVIKLYVISVKHLPQSDDREYYDENGNHIYYDRKIIRRLEREKQNH